jgi:hypothetical protein
MSRLADMMLRDPFPAPVRMNVPEGSLLQRVVERLLRPEERRTLVLFLTPTTWPQTIMGAKASKLCEVCGASCWWSPSSNAVEKDHPNLICLDCVLPIVREEARD